MSLKPALLGLRFVNHSVALWTVTACVTLIVYGGCANQPSEVETNPAGRAQAEEGNFNRDIRENAGRLFAQGREIFRYDTFGSEMFWGGKLGLHRAIAGEKFGGIGAGLSAKDALQAGLKVDTGKLPRILVEAIKGGSVSLERTETTLELLRADAVVGIKGVFDSNKKNLVSIGITCAICHSTVDDSLAKGIGRRLDGWPNRDLNVGAIISKQKGCERSNHVQARRAALLSTIYSSAQGACRQLRSECCFTG